MRRSHPTVSLATVHRWWRKFETNSETKHDPDVQRRELQQRLRKFVNFWKSSRSVRAIPLQVNLSISSTDRILKKDLDLSKKVAKLLPHELTEGEKVRRLTLIHNMLHRIRSDPSILDKPVSVRR